jgi:hypothetical protein
VKRIKSEYEAVEVATFEAKCSATANLFKAINGIMKQMKE